MQAEALNSLQRGLCEEIRPLLIAVITKRPAGAVWGPTPTMRQRKTTCRAALHLLLLRAAWALQAVAPRRATPVLAPPTADLVLIDGDNVRGKTAFAVSAQSLLAQTRTFAATHI